ncbi:MAG: hypothetical protein AAF846_00135 [Chloroflexota bacterium]
MSSVAYPQRATIGSPDDLSDMPDGIDRLPVDAMTLAHWDCYDGNQWGLGLDHSSCNERPQRHQISQFIVF